MNAASSTCDSSETISGTYSGTASYSYSNTGTQATGEVLASDFTASGGCTKRYTTTISPANLAKIWPRGDGRGAEWNSSDPAFAQTFTVTVQATIGCSNSATVSYDVVFGDNCAGDTFTIDPSKFSSNPTHALTYNLYDSQASLFWTDTAATSTNGYTSCGPLTWTITGVTPTPLSSAFTVDTVSTTKSIIASSTDPSDVATHTINVKVEYTNFATGTSNLDFTILIANPCETALSVSNSPNSISSPQYTVGASMYTEPAFTAWTISPSYCPVTYHAQAISPTPNDAGAIVVDPDTRVTTIQTNDLLMGLTSTDTTPETYSIVYYVKSPAGVDQTGTSPSQIVTIDMRVLNPCVGDTPDISNVLSAATLSYTINDA